MKRAIFILMILIGLNYVSAADFSITSIQQLSSNAYSGDFVQFKASVYSDTSNWCSMTCQYTAGSNSGYVSDSGNPPSTTLSSGNVQPFPFSVRAGGGINGNVSQELDVTCDRVANYINCWPGSITHSAIVNFTYLYAGDGICTSSKEKCATYQSFIGTSDCSCPSYEKCQPDGTRNPDANGCQTFCGNGIFEPQYEDCSCWQDFNCTSTKKCKPDNGRTQDSNGCSSFCGNGICEPSYENCTSCPTDCKKCDLSSCQTSSECDGSYCVWGFCWHDYFRIGDGHCDIGLSENCANSPLDCACPTSQRCNSAGFCETYCGNGICEASENGWCKADCHWCGDGVCDTNENCQACQQDCGICRTSPSPVASPSASASARVSPSASPNQSPSSSPSTINNVIVHDNPPPSASPSPSPAVVVIITNDPIVQNASIKTGSKFGLNIQYLKDNYYQIIFAIFGIILLIILVIIIIQKDRKIKSMKVQQPVRIQPMRYYGR